MPLSSRSACSPCLLDRSENGVCPPGTRFGDTAFPAWPKVRWEFIIRRIGFCTVVFLLNSRDFELVLARELGRFGSILGLRGVCANKPGAFVSGVSFAGCGFFLIHLAHHWALTTASWLPWALGLTWAALEAHTPRETRCAAWLLSAVLALQILPGHFQLAFETQICVLIMIGWSFFQNRRRCGGRV